MSGMDQSVIFVNEQEIKKYEKLVSEGHKKGSYWIIKRAFDIVFSLLFLFFLAPLLLIISAAVWIDDPHGSPFYKQIRVGRHGKLFYVYKFRTMVSNADELREELVKQNEADGLAFKIKDDPRITKVGKFLRKTSIDELPQFLNVLKGDMTIVGPRPALPCEVACYNERQKVRLMVTPGITCTWQVSPHRNDIGFDDWMEMDIQYIGHRSFFLDFTLIVKTVLTMAKGEGR